MSMPDTRSHHDHAIDAASFRYVMPSSSTRPRHRHQFAYPISRWCLLLLILLTDRSFCFQSIPVRRHPTSTSRTRSTTTISTTALAVASKSGAKLMETSEDFSESVLQTNSNRPVMVFFTAPWCGPCRLSTPVVKDVMKLFAKQMDTVEVCTDDLPEVAAVAGVVSIPTIQMYYRGQLMDTIVGCVAKSVLSSAVEKVMEDAAVQFGRSGDANRGDQSADQ